MRDEPALEVGTLARDTKVNRVGRVMGAENGRLYLRDVNGGREWEAEPGDVRRADANDELRARVAEANAAGRWGSRPVRFTIIRAAEWTLGSETAEGAPEGIHSALCVACGAESEHVDDSRLPVEVWALRHTGRNPTHRQYKATVECFWRVDPAPGNPYFGLPDGGADPLAHEKAPGEFPRQGL